ncbi:IS66 family insertion sequence element accessory protein TnpB [Rhodobacter capsulatus]|uniref:IS66 family insertion sequence element accessory protein TnpB n=1 Tax=Rhodobacter capsulatus TaxID=1061 RepID=UPI004029FFB7
MIAFPAGTRVWIAGGVTDMRCGMNSLALKIQQGLGRDPHSGEIFCFRGRKADVVKLLWFDGIGVSLYAKRLEAGKFVWPSSATGAAVAISAAQLGYLLDDEEDQETVRGTVSPTNDWRNPRWTQRPKKMG